MNTFSPTVPKTGLAGLKENWRYDIVSGFLVFLIALPLCLGVANASGFPAMSGVISAIIGGLLVSRINGTHVTVTGPAAGLIVVILSAVQALGQGDAMAGYRYTLAAIFVSGLLQIGLGSSKAGRLSAFFPSTVIHGMLAAIGIIIMAKQIPLMAGVQPLAGPVLPGIANIPHDLAYFIPQIAFIGLASLGILIFWPKINHPWLKKIPAPIVVILVGMALGQWFDLAHLKAGQDFILPKDLVLGPEFLVDIPDTLLASLYLPDFSKIGSMAFWESVVAITLVGSLETLLVASAVDKLDPYKRYSDLNRDLRALGLGNALSGLVGGLPIIVEILRSSTNVNSGARTAWSSFFHGAFMLLFVMLFPRLIDKIPLASLATLLVYIGYRLTSPQTFAERMILGWAQLLIFVITIAGVLFTNILAGVLIGIVAKLLIHWMRGVSPKNMLQIAYRVERKDGNTWIFRISGSAIFSNFISLKTEVSEIPNGKTVIFDLSDVYLIDHTVMELIDHFRQNYMDRGGQCEIEGLDKQVPFSEHVLAARRRRL
ncbi:MAG: SulP family inorganic anion transporter [Proteobacteria bacterium]|nr:SulP family inorganic anion transporter [Pseudomonadota bacterium]